MARYVMIDEDVSIEGLLTMLQRAHQELSALCHGKPFRMSVPCDDADSDLIIGDALRHAEAFVKATQQLRQQGGA